MISDFLPQKGGRFYSLAKEYASNGTPIAGNKNWLSDSLDNIDAIPDTSTDPKTGEKIKRTRIRNFLKNTIKV